MSTLFNTLTPEEWTEQGGGGSAPKGLYRRLLEEFIATGERYANIPTAADSGGHFAGKKASSISTSLKGARDAKEVPAEFEAVQVSSRGGVVFLENTAVTA